MVPSIRDKNNINMASGGGLGGLQALQKLWGDVSPTVQTLLEMDFKNMTLKDYVTIIGFAYTAGKTLYAVYGMMKVVKVHGVSKVMRPNLKKKFGEWAVVTGCCRGIGEAYVRELAKAGMNVALLTNQEIPLRELAEEIEKKYKVQTEQILVDVHDQSERYSMLEERLQGKEIGLLMNNVGVHPDAPEDFADLDSADIANMMVTNMIPTTMEIYNMMTHNMIPTTMMTHMLLPQMLERGRGAIIIVAAGGIDEPTPQMTLYGSTKAYLSHFAESLHQEYKDEGITIQCLTPYMVATEDSNLEASLLVPSSSTYAKSALCTLGYSHRTTGSFQQNVQAWVDRAIPHWIRYWLMDAFNSTMQQTAADKLGVNLEKLDGPKLADGSRPFTGSLAGFLEGVSSVG